MRISDWSSDVCSSDLPARRRQDGDAEAVVEPRQLLDLRIDPAARTRHPRDLLDHRRAFVVLQLDLDFRETAADLFSTVITDIAFALQDIEDVSTQRRSRRTHLPLPRPPSIADTRQQDSEGIAHSRAEERRGRTGCASTVRSWWS